MQPGSKHGAGRRSRGLFPEIDRVHLSWPKAWLKTAVIVVYFVVATVWLPSRIVQAGFVARLPRFARDLIGSGAWLIPMALGIYALWWAERNRRI